MKLSKVRAFDLLFGTFLTRTLITIGQIIILIGIAMAFGYKHQGDLSASGLAALIGVIAGMASISLALMIASFTENNRQAMSLSAMLSVPLGFMAGFLSRYRAKSSAKLQGEPTCCTIFCRGRGPSQLSGRFLPTEAG